jgi:hypothetical protein
LLVKMTPSSFTSSSITISVKEGWISSDQK